MATLNHKHLIVNAFVKNPFVTENEVIEWLTRLVRKVNMNIFMHARARYCSTAGNEGVTGDVVIETSHASIHIWSEQERPRVSFDLYSCSDFDEDDVLEMLDEMDCNEWHYMTIDRNHGLRVLESKREFVVGSI